MKNTLKIFVLIILVLFIAGCSKVTTNITYKSSGKVKEEVVFDEPNSNVSDNDSKIEKNLSTIVNKYSLAIKTMKYDYEIIKGTNSSKVIFTNTYNDICAWVRKNMFSQYVYKRVDCTSDGDFYVIKSMTNHIDYCDGCSDWPNLDEVTLNITLPIKSIENNADSVSNYTYTWRFDKYTPKSKSIYLKINKKELDDKVERLKSKKENKEKIQKSIAYIIMFSIIIVLIVFGFSIFRKYKENKIEY